MKPLLTPIGKLTGFVAIRFAQENGLTLNANASWLGGDRFGLSPDEALELAVRDPNVVWLEIK